MINFNTEIDWIQGHIKPWWNSYDFINIPYIKGDTNTPQSEDWIEMGYAKQSLYGSMYDAKNEMPHWMSPFIDLFNWKHFGWTMYKMKPGEIIPWHRDLFLKYIQLHSIKNVNTIVRAVIFVEDWKSGHYIEIDETPVIKWKAGDFVLWRYNTPHVAGNFGNEDRYTLQLTGVS